MAVVVKKDNKKYAVLGAGLRQGNFGAPEEPYLIACDKDGNIEILLNFSSNALNVVDINGKSPEELLK